MISNQLSITQNIEEEFLVFIDYLRNLEKKSASYSKVKDTYYKYEWNKKKIILQELSQLNFSNPISKIHDLYLKVNYDTLLLLLEIKDIENILVNSSKDRIYSAQEKLGFIKRILDVFLDYYIKQKFNPIVSSLNKLNSMEYNIKASLDIIKSTKDKQSIFKEKVLINHGKYLLKLQKVILTLKVLLTLY